jgi:hypothetical protein
LLVKHRLDKIPNPRSTIFRCPKISRPLICIFVEHTPNSKEEDNYQMPCGSAETLRDGEPPYRVNGNGNHHNASFIDLFCGIGGFRLAFERAGGKCVFSSDWDKHSQVTYAANFGEKPHGDIYQIACL